MAENFQSNFVFGLQGNLYQDFLNQVACPIIQNIIGTDDYEVIDFDKHLSLSDFDKNKRKDSIFPEFYLNFLGDIIKDSNSVSFKKKVCITLDERLCRDICPNTERKITAIKLGGVELAYFIYFNIKEFFDFVYGDEIQKYQPLKNKNIIHQNYTKLKNESFGNKIEDIEQVDEQNSNPSILDKSIIPKLFSGKKNDDNLDIVEKIGYIHSHKDFFSFVRTSTKRNDTFRLPHKIFPESQELSIGTVIKAKCEIDEFGKIKKVKSYELRSEKELDLAFEEFEGTLKRDIGKNFAFIKNYGTSIYVPPRLAQYFNENQVYNTQCLAVESLDKNGNLGWEALEVIEILPFNWKVKK